MSNGIVYRLTFPNGKVYIGITTELLSRRIQRHIDASSIGKLYALSRAIRKYGKASFEVTVLWRGPASELKRIEVREIYAHNCMVPNGYNMTHGGDGAAGVVITAEVRKKISLALSGRTLSEEHKRKVSLANKGKSIPVEVRQKMREAARRRCSAPMPEDQRNKISRALTGKKLSAESIAKRNRTRYGK